MVKKMPNKSDDTKKILEHLLGELYKKQSLGDKPKGDSFLKAQDDQFLGRITTNKYDKDSIINQYGPYGSKYSGTSIFNQYSPYGSRYGAFSVNNPFCQQPPRLFINGNFIAYITNNVNINPKIDSSTFIRLVKDNLSGILNLSPGDDLKFTRDDSYLIAYDGTFLGKLTSNIFDRESILNQFGNFGSQFSTSSIFNQFSTYGSEFSSLSPYNQFTSTPPQIFINGQFWGHLTKNNFVFGNTLDPDKLVEWINQNNL
jgi:hypothetical protein